MSLEVSSLRALAHPVRLRILSLLTGVAMSASEVARELDISQANASYHVRTLAAAGFLEEVGEETIRGGVAKKYAYATAREQQPTVDSDDPGARLVFTQAMADELVRRSQQFAPGGPKSYTDAEVWLDPDDWKRALALAEECSSLVHDRATPPRTAGTVHVNATIAMFRMQP